MKIRNPFLFFKCTLALASGAVLWLTGALTCNLAGAVTSTPAAFHVRQWTSEDGLPANRITAMAQTPDGYLWVGTWFGLARFDGVRFVVFNGANTPAFRAEAVSALAVDRKDGALWIGTPEALVRFKDGRFERLAETGGSSSMSWNITELLAASGGGVWIRADDKVSLWPPAWNGWRKLPFVYAERGRASWENEERALVIMTQQRFFRVARDGSTILLDPPTGLSTNHAWTGAWPKDRRGRFWAGTQRGLYRQGSGKWEAVAALPYRAFPNDRFLESKSGAMWVGHGGVGLVRHGDDVQQTFLLGTRGAEKSVDCLLEDREGHIWAGSTQGLFQVRPAIIRTITEEDGLPHRECWSVSEASDGAVWVGTRTGLARLHGEQVTDALPDEPNRPRSASILVDRDGWFWSGRKHNGITRWMPGRETNQFFHRLGSDAASGVDLGALYLDRKDRVWIGTGRGAVWFENGRPAVSFGGQGLPTNSIRSIYQTRDGAMWFGTWKAGVVRWAPLRDTERGDSKSRNGVPDNDLEVDHSLFTSDAKRFTSADGLTDDRVFVFHEDADGALWIGTHNGLSRYKDGKFFNFRSEHGLLDNLINWLEEDDFSRLWFSCNRGLFHISRAELNDVADGKKPRAHAFVYGVADGMLNPETNGEMQPAGCKTRDGRIWFPTMDGVVAIDPRHTLTTEVAPVAVIEEARADGLPFGNLARLPAGRARDLQIRYTANSFLDPRRNRFQYRLTHHDAGWRDETTERLAVYTNLRPGDYRFELRAANAHGVWSHEATVLAFSLRPHFWQTWTFYAFGCLGVIGLAAGITAYRLRWQHRLLTARHDQALAEERARIARDLHDDLGTALTGVALELDVGRQQSRDGVAARLGDGAARIRALAERMREVVWAVNPVCDTVSSLASFLEQQAGALLNAGDVHVQGRFEFPEDIPALPLDSNTRHQLALAVREALTNVLRHARASEVTLALALNDGALVVSVEDNGCGFDADGTGTQRGHGLHNLCTRLEHVGGTAVVKSTPGRGTRVEFRVPLARALPRRDT